MIKKSLLFLILLAFLCHNSFSQDSTSAFPIKVKYGIYIKKLEPDFKTGKFVTEFYWWTLFHNDSVKTDYTQDDIMNMEYVNCSDCETGQFMQDLQEFRVLDSNYFYFTGRHEGEFTFNPNFSDYPFDKQALPIKLENVLITSDQLLFETDTVSYFNSKQDPKFYGISDDLLSHKSREFNITGTKFIVNPGVYNTNFGDPDMPFLSKYSRMETQVHIDRAVIPYLAKILLPIMIILFLVYFAFYIPAERIDVNAALTVTSLLSAIAFQMAINSSLPNIGYLIYVDKLFLLCYSLIVLAMAESIVTYYLDRTGVKEKVRMAIKTDIVFRFLFPVLFFIGCFVFI
ncbi:MAG: hypothetical protein V1904_14865 [Bacteroidota bacterium]